MALLCLSTTVAEAHAWWLRRQAPPTPIPEEVARFTVEHYFDLANHTVPPLQLSGIALKGQNLGGAGGKPPAGEPVGVRQYTVQTGDTLSAIASKYNLHTGSIMLVNSSITDSSLLEVGQVLTIPEKDASDTELAKVVAAPPKKVAAASVPSQKTVQSIASVSGLQMPVSYSYVSQGFSGAHQAVDLVAPIGTPIYAAADGCAEVAANGWNGGYGNYVKLSHSGGLETLYAHMSYFIVQSGQCVSAGALIGYVGVTGRSTGAHLHWGVFLNGVPQPPPIR